MLHSNIARKKKNYLGAIFFEGACVGIIVDGVGVMAELEDLVYESEEEQRLVEEEERAKGKEKTAKEASRRKRGHRKRPPLEEAHEEES